MEASLTKQNEIQPSVDIAIDLASAYSRAFDRCSKEMAIVHEFIIDRLNKIPKPDSDDRNERFGLRFTKISPLVMQDSTINSALKTINLEVNRLTSLPSSGETAPAAIIVPIAVGFAYVFAVTYAVWCNQDPSGC
jgi:hypothetical protein